jgi:intracellular sulfur oxidation DsrE/DsrF family protein
MKQFPLLLLSLSLITTFVNAQSDDKALENNKAYPGAKAGMDMYHAIYQLDNNDPKIVEKAFRGINNVLKDPRLAGKIQIELISYSDGTEALMKGSKYEEDLKMLVQKGVIVAQCANTLKSRNISPNQLYDFIAIVPSANGELIIRHGEGWAIIKP